MAAYPAVKEAQGATLKCSVTSWTAELTDIKRTGPKFEKLDVTKLSSTLAKEYIQSALYDPGELDVSYHWNPDNQYSLTATGETFTITYPTIGTNTQASTFAIVGFMLEVPHQIPIGKIMDGTLKVQLTGVQTHVATG